MLAHHGLQFLDSKVVIKADCPFANCTVSFQATVWSPYVGQRLGQSFNAPYFRCDIERSVQWAR